MWAFWEAGADYWAFFPRLLVPLAIFSVGLFLFSSTRTRQGRWSMGLGVIALVAAVAFFGRGFVAVPIVAADTSAEFKIAQSDNVPVDWTAFSRDSLGTRFSPFTQIDRENVKNLELAWTYRTGRDVTKPNNVDQNTPLQIGNVLYSCTPENAVHAIDATTGQRKWLFETNETGNFSGVTRRAKGVV